ncbi:MAG TPA: hypothetical protein VJ867_14945 [Gemmatimonadaceae bacterium]|nr:hypothetical protein [Gemmatimonadaceae bacterium]
MKRAVVFLLACVAGCAPGVSTGSGGAATPAQQQTPAQQWPVLTRRHVDLWLHGYAMLLRDTAQVPVFRKDYRAKIEALKAQRNVKTMLDVNRERLQQRLTLNPAIFNGQFVPMYFASYDQMRQVITYFLQAEGNIGATNDPALRQYFAVLGQSFPTAADREWLRLFSESLEDERKQFYDAYWTAENASRVGFVRLTDSIWQGDYRQKLQRFLNNTQQESGDLVLSMVLGGEGRTVNFGSRQNAVAVTWPENDAHEAIYVFAHEIVGTIVATAVNDNTTPTEQRAGTAARYVTVGQVRAGAMLLDRAARELFPGYMRYYLAQAGQPTSGDLATLTSRFNSTFPIPDVVRDAVQRQLDVVLGGI